MNYFTPKEASDAFRITAINKSKRTLPEFAVMAILGGAFIALGGLLTVMVAGGMPGVAAANPGIVKFVAGALFPVGLIMVSITGADLFTSNCAGYTFPLLKKELPVLQIVKILTLSYLFNFVGTQFIAFILSGNVGLFDADPWRSYLHTYSEAKVNKDFMTVFVKGIGANWLVCLGMLMGYTAKDTIGRAIGIWVPVMMFVTMGYEHSIANMFFIPAAIYTGAGISWGDFVVANLLPSTLGNIIGGMLLVGCVYYYLFLKQGKKETTTRGMMPVTERVSEGANGDTARGTAEGVTSNANGGAASSVTEDVKSGTNDHPENGKEEWHREMDERKN